MISDGVICRKVFIIAIPFMSYSKVSIFFLHLTPLRRDIFSYIWPHNWRLIWPHCASIKCFCHARWQKLHKMAKNGIKWPKICMLEIKCKTFVTLPGTLLYTQHSPGHCQYLNGCLATSWSLDALLGYWASYRRGILVSVAKFIFGHGVGCRKKSFILGVQDAGKIGMLILE